MTETTYIMCPNCGKTINEYKKPSLTVDIIIEFPLTKTDSGIILIKRKNPPYGWAIPGGFVNYGETVETAAIREAHEETSLTVKLNKLLGVYSAPQRDARGHTVSVVFTAEGGGKPAAQDDADEIQIFTKHNLPSDLAFDHAEILNDYFQRM